MIWLIVKYSLIQLAATGAAFVFIMGMALIAHGVVSWAQKKR